MSDWKTKTLGEVTSYIAKGIPPKYVEEANDDTICVLNQKCNRNFRISYDDSRLHNNAAKKVPDVKMLKPGDVLINSTGTGTAGRVAQIWDIEAPTTIDGHMILMRPTDEIDPLYYGYAVKAFQAVIESYAEGSTGQTEINKTRLQNETIITYPVDKDEQSKIARILAAIDEKILLNEEVNKNLEQQALSIFAQEFLSFDGALPEGWREGNLLDIADYLNGLAMQKFRPKDEEVGIPVLKIKELRQGSCDDSSELCSPSIKPEYIVHDGDVIFSWSGSLLVDFWCGGTCGLNQHLFKVTSKSYDKWFYYAWTNYHLAKFIALAADMATTMGHIKREELAKSAVLIPSDSDYERIGSILRPLYDLIVSNRMENRKLSTLRDELLPKLMNGNIDVSEVSL